MRMRGVSSDVFSSGLPYFPRRPDPGPAFRRSCTATCVAVRDPRAPRRRCPVVMASRAASRRKAGRDGELTMVSREPHPAPDKRSLGTDASDSILQGRAEIGRAHVCTQVTNAHIVCRLLLEKKKKTLQHKHE